MVALGIWLIQRPGHRRLSGGPGILDGLGYDGVHYCRQMRSKYKSSVGGQFEESVENEVTRLRSCKPSCWGRGCVALMLLVLPGCPETLSRRI